MRKQKIFLGVFLIAVLVFFGRFLFSDELETTFYHLYSSKIHGAQTTRLVVLSDLHNREFGQNNKDLTEQIQVLKPDLIVIAGDMVNADNDNLDIILNLCEKLVKIAPVYYSPMKVICFMKKISLLKKSLMRKASMSWSTGLSP